MPNKIREITIVSTVFAALIGCASTSAVRGDVAIARQTGRVPELISQAQGFAESRQFELAAETLGDVIEIASRVGDSGTALRAKVEQCRFFLLAHALGEFGECASTLRAYADRAGPADRRLSALRTNGLEELGRIAAHGEPTGDRVPAALSPIIGKSDGEKR